MQFIVTNFLPKASRIDFQPINKDLSRKTQRVFDEDIGSITKGGSIKDIQDLRTPMTTVRSKKAKEVKISCFPSKRDLALICKFPT